MRFDKSVLSGKPKGKKKGFQVPQAPEEMCYNKWGYRNADVGASGELWPTNVRQKLKHCIPFEN